METYQFRNLVFEGGGVKGIAYVGALDVLTEKGILPEIERVGGTSAGAINATLLALGYTLKETRDLLWELDFRKFMDGSFFIVNLARVLFRFGWYRGDFFRNWIGYRIEEKTGNRGITFSELARLNIGPKLSVIVTNLSRTFSEVYSADFPETRDAKVMDAVRMSMSIPLFFKAVRENGEVFVDGGVFRNYPVKLFDHRRYIRAREEGLAARLVDYYAPLNRGFPDDSKWPFVYNRQTLGFRLDSKEEILMFREHKAPPARPIPDIGAYLKELVKAIFGVQEIQHLHSDDWQRTVYVDTLGIGTTNFGLTNKQKEDLVKSGRAGTKAYFKWLESEAGRAEAKVYAFNA